MNMSMFFLVFVTWLSIFGAARYEFASRHESLHLMNFNEHGCEAEVEVYITGGGVTRPLNCTQMYNPEEMARENRMIEYIGYHSYALLDGFFFGIMSLLFGIFVFLDSR